MRRKKCLGASTRPNVGLIFLMMQLILERKGRGRTNYVVLVNNVVIQSIKHQTGLGSWIKAAIQLVCRVAAIKYF